MRFRCLLSGPRSPPPDGGAQFGLGRRMNWAQWPWVRSETAHPGTEALASRARRAGDGVRRVDARPDLVGAQAVPGLPGAVRPRPDFAPRQPGAAGLRGGDPGAAQRAAGSPPRQPPRWRRPGRKVRKARRWRFDRRPWPSAWSIRSACISCRSSTRPCGPRRRAFATGSIRPDWSRTRCSIACRRHCARLCRRAPR